MPKKFHDFRLNPQLLWILALEENGGNLKEKCPKECQTTKYSVVTSELGFGDPEVYRKIMNNVTGFNKTYDETKEYVR